MPQQLPPALEPVDPAVADLKQAMTLDKDEKTESPWVKALKRFRKHRLAVAALVTLVIISLLALLAPVIQRYEPNKPDLRSINKPPSEVHWFGTDKIGRDIWSRTVHGGRVSIAVGLSAALLATLIGTAIGAVSGYYGGKIDMFLMRFTDLIMTFPSLIIMITLATVLGQGLLNVIIIIGALSWPGVARLVRGQFLSFREQQFVKAARCLGASDGRIIFDHILPNVVAPLLAQVTFTVGNAILTEAGMSFLGLGVPLPTATWGNMLETARNLDILQFSPWMWAPAAVFTTLTILCVNFIGDGLRDAIDPRLIL